MSLFIGLLAFPEAETLQNEVKVGVLLGSCCPVCLVSPCLAWPTERL
jgi:Na+/H+ antiporter NhaA